MSFYTNNALILGAAPSFALSPFGGEVYYYQRPRTVQRSVALSPWAFGQFAPFEEAFDRMTRELTVDEDDDFLAGTALGRRAPRAAEADAAEGAEGAAADGAAEAKLPASYSYSSYSSSVTAGGKTRTVVRKRYSDADGGDKSLEQRSVREGEKYYLESKAGGDEATYEGADAAAFAAAWGAAPALAAGSEEAVAPAASDEAAAAREEPVAPADKNL
mmetsp:Transcript_4800/g.14240  ORF Transcript_4800/g.14240 Transcript_4800/m.14240 type:complete len:217 (+) Transcript_4800:132-782(+)|eukprot:CAMPEP_0119259748 /NCGR_PEP_ID=MMETSP1329-20130426/443_1 /TAXON_ID=114041 /ORGANISM="Genus nov. species nov., Strain RCC1024" /LENGTH=216 /DNA_ID=CAMNT_0007259149 /DNA_START=125 /DNA_END=775 /DNA_ORIENTATION=-